MAKIKFNEAIAFFRQKLDLPTSVWTDIQGEAQDWAFTVAGLEKAQMLQAVQELILRVLEGKTSVATYEEFARDFNQLMTSSGYGELKPWRTRLIFSTNTRQAYNAGRYRTQTSLDNRLRRPYLQYIHDHPLEDRPHHKAIDKSIWRADDPIWDTIYPLNGFGCRCQVTSLSERDMEREGLSVSPYPPATVSIRDRVTGETKQVPAVILPVEAFKNSGIPQGAIVSGNEVTAPIAEPGFAHAPGSSLRERRDKILEQSIGNLRPDLQRRVRDRAR